MGQLNGRETAPFSFFSVYWDGDNKGFFGGVFFFLVGFIRFDLN